MSDYFLPRDYCPNPPIAHGGEPYWTEPRIKLSHRYQYHVYQLAAAIASRESRFSIADVGCGPATKLLHFFGEKYELYGFDLPESIQICKQRHERGVFSEVDFDGAVNSDGLQKKFELIICADIIEHLANPAYLIDFIRDIAAPDAKILWSTPNRNRLYASETLSPANPAHVREWSDSEFKQFVESFGFTVLQQLHFPIMRLGFDLYSIQNLAMRISDSERANPNQLLVCQYE